MDNDFASSIVDDLIRRQNEQNNEIYMTREMYMQFTRPLVRSLYARIYEAPKPEMKANWKKEGF